MPDFVAVEIENVMRSATGDIRANPRVVAACPRSIAYCTNHNSQKDGNGKVIMVGDKVEGIYSLLGMRPWREATCSS